MFRLEQETMKFNVCIVCRYCFVVCNSVQCIYCQIDCSIDKLNGCLNCRIEHLIGDHTTFELPN